MLHPIQALRLFSALWVVLYHAAHSPTVAPGNGLWHNFTGLGYLGVDIFFVISGYIMALNSQQRSPSLRQSLSFLGLRLARIYSGWWPVFLLCCTLLGSAALQGKDLLGSFFLYQLNFNILVLPVTWTLTFELYFYAVIALSLLLPQHLRTPTFWLLALGLLITNSWWVMHERFNIENIGQSHYGMHLFFSPLCLEFLLGYQLQRLQPQLQRIFPTLALLACTALCAAAVYGYAAYFAHKPSGLAGFFHSPERALLGGSLAGSLLLLFLRLGRYLPRRLSLWGGDISYLVYLLHLPCIWLLPRWLPSDNPMHLPALIAGTISLASLMHYTLERPIYRKCKRRFDTAYNLQHFKAL